MVHRDIKLPRRTWNGFKLSTDTTVRWPETASVCPPRLENWVFASPAQERLKLIDFGLATAYIAGKDDKGGLRPGTCHACNRLGHHPVDEVPGRTQKLNQMCGTCYYVAPAACWHLVVEMCRDSNSSYAQSRSRSACAAWSSQGGDWIEGRRNLQGRWVRTRGRHLGAWGARVHARQRNASIQRQVARRCDLDAQLQPEDVL